MTPFVVTLASLWADAPNPKVEEPVLTMREDTSRYETTPWIKKIDLIKTNNLVRVIVKASAQTECYKQREIERIFEKNVVKIVLRLKKPLGATDCPTNLFDYEEKVYESTLDLAPPYIWILGYEGWHKMQLQ